MCSFEHDSRRVYPPDTIGVIFSFIALTRLLFPPLPNLAPVIVIVLSSSLSLELNAIGMSELNPVLTEELARLRRTNEQLVAKVKRSEVK